MSVTSSVLVPVRRSILPFIGVLMVACSTPYQEKAFTGGYVDRIVTPSTRIVEFWGNGGMSRKRVASFALFRCAEVTLLNGYDYFVVDDQKWLTEAEAQEEIKRRGRSSNDYFVVRAGIGGGILHGLLGGSSKPIEKPVLRLHIAFDAKELQREVAEQYPDLKKRLVDRPLENVS
jgi:hypothetical protein